MIIIKIIIHRMVIIIIKVSKMKELPPSARFAKEMWGRKR